MSDNTGIEWADATWNPVTGCTEVSPGCDHCYARSFAERWQGTPGHYFEHGFEVTLRPDKLEQPLHWWRPRRVFVNSMSDLFHKDVPAQFIAEVFAVMAQADRHVFQLLTKRHARMRSLLAGTRLWRAVENILQTSVPWPLPNLWVGVSAEDQRWLDIRLQALVETPAAVRFLSCEPLLGPVRIPFEVNVGCPACGNSSPYPCDHGCGTTEGPAAGRIHWVIAGGESGPGARPMHPGWARGLRDQCTTAGVPFFFKQWGEYLPVPVTRDPAFSGGRAFNSPKGGHAAPLIREAGGPFRPGTTRPMRAGDRNGHGVMLDDDTIAVRMGKGRAGRLLDGRTWDEFPCTSLGVTA